MMRNFLWVLALIGLWGCAPRHATLVAYDQAEALQEAAILVPLPSAEHRAQRYEKYGEHKKAENLRKKFLKPNTRIIQAFDTYFTYCPVYFYFYPFDSSRSYVEGRGLMDGKGQMVSLDSEVEPFFATFDERVENQGERDREYTALILRDSQFREIGGPFPGETEVNGYPSQSSIEAAVRRLQVRLLKLDDQRREALQKAE